MGRLSAILLAMLTFVNIVEGSPETVAAFKRHETPESAKTLIKRHGYHSDFKAAPVNVNIKMSPKY